MAKDLPAARRARRRPSFHCILVLACPLFALLPAVATAGKSAAAFYCYNDGALRVTCTGTFRDGASAAAFIVRVYNQNGELLLTERVSAYGHFTFRKPDADFRVVLEAGGGDVVTIAGRDVT